MSNNCSAGPVKGFGLPSSGSGASGSTGGTGSGSTALAMVSSLSTLAAMPTGQFATINDTLNELRFGLARQRQQALNRSDGNQFPRSLKIVIKISKNWNSAIPLIRRARGFY